MPGDGLADKIRSEIAADPKRAYGLILSQELTHGSARGQWYAHCPFHNDTHASWRLDPAKSVWYCDVCREGGDLFDLTKRLHGTTFKGAVTDLAELFALNGHANAPKLLVRTLRYEVRDLEGKLRATHVRREYDNGSKEMPWDPLGTKPAELPLYGINRSFDFSAGDEIIVVEGEKCADSLWERGFLSAATFGTSAIPSDDALKALLRFKVYLWPDNDDIGRVHMRAIATSLLRLGHRDVWWMEWKGAPAKGDAADFDGDLQELFDAAVLYEPPQEKRTRGEFVKDVERKVVEWLWPNYIPLGKLSDLQGDPGSGKSALTAALAAVVSTGGKWPTGQSCQAGGVIMVSGEDDLPDTIRPRLEALGANIGRIITFTLRDEVLFELPRDIPLLENTIKEIKARLVIFDPLDQFVSEELDTNKNQSIRKLLAVLAKLAGEMMISIVVVRHLNKDSNTKNPMYRGGGSIGLNAASRQVFIIGPSPDDIDVKVLAHVKGNCAPPPPSLGFRLESTQLHNPEQEIVTVKWIGEVPFQGWELLQDPQQRAKAVAKGEKLTQTVEALRNILADGAEHEADPIEQQLKAELRVSHATIFEAKKQLGVKSSRKGYPGVWRWRIATDSYKESDDSDSSERW